MLAYVQLLAAEHAVGAGDERSARRRLEEALSAALAVKRSSDAAIARAMLVPLCRRANDSAAAAEHLEALSEDLRRPQLLSARAREAADGVVAASA